MTAAMALGRRYACDFRVLAIVDNERVVLLLRGQPYTLSIAELEALVNSGLVAEVQGGGT